MVRQPDDSNAPLWTVYPAKLAKPPESHTKYDSINTTDTVHPPLRKLLDQHVCNTTKINSYSRAVSFESSQPIQPRLFTTYSQASIFAAFVCGASAEHSDRVRNAQEKIVVADDFFWL
jgi:hypothetical protein